MGAGWDVMCDKCGWEFRYIENFSPAFRLFEKWMYDRKPLILYSLAGKHLKPIREAVRRRLKAGRRPLPAMNDGDIGFPCLAHACLKCHTIETHYLFEFPDGFEPHYTCSVCGSRLIAGEIQEETVSNKSSDGSESDNQDVLLLVFRYIDCGGVRRKFRIRCPKCGGTHLVIKGSYFVN